MMADEEIDKLFAEMTKGMEPEMLDANHAPVALDYQAMDKIELMDAFNETYNVLLEHEALLNPKTDEDKDLQGRYYGLLLEMKRRGLKGG